MLNVHRKLALKNYRFFANHTFSKHDLLLTALENRTLLFVVPKQLADEKTAKENLDKSKQYLNGALFFLLKA